MGDDNTGEFDPYFIERIKNSLQLMIDKRFLEVIENDIHDNNCFQLKRENQIEVNSQEKKQATDDFTIETARKGTEKKKNQIYQDPTTP